MLIRITDLPPEGITISEAISLESLNARLNEGQSCDIKFTSAPQIDVVVSRTADGAETVGKVTTKYLQPCGRCSDEMERDLVARLDFILKPKPPHVTDENAAEYADDLGILYFEGEHVDLESAAQESLILSLSRYWSPPIDSKGACTLCHKDLRKPSQEAAPKKEVVSLGELLKKAGVN